MSVQERFGAEFGLDATNNTVVNMSDPVNNKDGANKEWSLAQILNATSGTMTGNAATATLAATATNVSWAGLTGPATSNTATATIDTGQALLGSFDNSASNAQSLFTLNESVASVSSKATLNRPRILTVGTLAGSNAIPLEVIVQGQRDTFFINNFGSLQYTGLSSASNGGTAGSSVGLQGGGGGTTTVGGTIVLSGGNASGGGGGVVQISSGSDTAGGNGANLALAAGTSATGTNGSITFSTNASVQMTLGPTGTLSLSTALPISSGGTGASTASAALSALGGVASSLLGVSNGVATLDGTGKVPTSQLPASVAGGVVYQGTWNASTNTPTLTSGSGTKGYYYKVSVAGSTTVDGNSSWIVGDMIIFDGTTWDKIDGSPTEVSSVAGRIGAVTLAQADIAGLTTSSSPTFAAVTATTFTGALTGNATSASSTPWSGLGAPTASNSVTATANTSQALLGTFNTSAPTTDMSLFMLGENTASTYTHSAPTANDARILTVATLVGSTAYPFEVIAQGVRNVLTVNNAGSLNYAGVSGNTNASGLAGSLNLTTGSGTNTNISGSATIATNSASGGGTGGITISTGNDTSTGTPGNINLTTGSNTSGTTGSLNFTTGSFTQLTINSSGINAVNGSQFNGSLSGNATTASNVNGGGVGSILYQSAANTTAFLASGSGVLVGGSTPSWSASPTLTGTNFTGIPNGALSNSSITIGSSAVSLGGTIGTIAGLSSVTSTTFVGNLTGNANTATTAGSASSLGGATFAAPGAIGSTTPSTGVFTTLQATNIGTGGAASTTTGVLVQNSALTGASQTGVAVQPTFSTAATTVGYGVYVQGTQAAGSQTTPNVYGVYVDNAVSGSGATITNSIGLAIADQTNGTNNYGIRSALSSGTNKWNIYVSGTANNFLGTGRTSIGAVADNGTDALQVNGSAYVKTTLKVAGVMTGNQTLQLGNATSTQGGSVVLVNDAGGFGWQAGIRSTAGSTAYSIVDLSNSTSALTITVGTFAINMPGTLTANAYNGAGTGLTGTAASLSIGGNAATATTATSVSGTVAIANGGTGATTAATAATALGLGTTSSPTFSAVTATTFTGALSGTATTATNIAGGAAGSIPYQTGSGTTALLPQAAGVLVGGTTPSFSTTPTLTGTNFTNIPYSALSGTVPTWNQNTTGTAANVTGTVAIAKGGTGATTASAALTALGGASLGANTFTGAQNLGNQNITNVNNITLNGEFANTWASNATSVSWANGKSQNVTLTSSGTITIGSPSGPGWYQLKVIQNSTGGFTVTWSGINSTNWLGSATAPALNTNANGVTIVNFYFDGTSIFQSLSRVGEA